MCCIEVGQEKTLCLLSSLCYFLSFLGITAMGSESVDEKVRHRLISYFLSFCERDLRSGGRNNSIFETKSHRRFA